MTLFREILSECELLEEDVSQRKVDFAIKGLHPASIKYNSGGEGKAAGYRVIYPIADGVTTAGEPVVRAFQTGGSSKTSVPAWKLFRLDRVTDWVTSKRQFDPDEPALQKGFQLMNPEGDKSMAQVYNISPIGAAKNLYRRTITPEKISDRPITKQDVEDSSVRLADPVSNAEERNNYSANDTIDNFLSKNGKKEPETIDNGVKKAHTNISRNANNLASGPVTKSQVEGEPEIEGSVNTNFQINTPVNQTPADNKPVMKSDIDGNEEAENRNNELTNSYKDMLRRMDNLNKEEEEENGSNQ